MLMFYQMSKNDVVRVTIVAAAMLFVLTNTVSAAAPEYELEPIRYSSTPAVDPVAGLKKAIERAEKKVEIHSDRGYLDALLRELEIPTSSQVMVFTKASMQGRGISPARPRAIYFNDDTYVGYIPGAEVLEIISIDAMLGPVFYTIDQSVAAKLDRDAAAHPPEIERRTGGCLACHDGSSTRGTPGLFVKSVFPDVDGFGLLQYGSFNTTHESPLSERWGGWYVTGSAGGQAHMGNAHWKRGEGREPEPINAGKTELSDLSNRIDVSPYPTAHSDIVALMVFEHQAEMHNRITRASYGVRRALRDEKAINDAFGETPAPDAHSESTMRRVSSDCEPLVKYLLFAGEAPLTAKIEGSTTFAAEFSKRGPRDSKGRSLRDLELNTRLLRYPFSYLIYSSSIDGLPDLAKTYVYRRLWEVLGGKDTSPDFAHLSVADRTAIMEILRETKPDIHDAWSALEKVGK